MQLAEFIVRNRSAILRSWENEARSVLPVGRLDCPVLLDDAPRILDELREALSRGQSPSSDLGLGELACARNAILGDTQVSLADVIRELALLRSSVVRLWHATWGRAAREAAQWTALVDSVIERIIDHDLDARRRLYSAFEQIGDAAFDIDDLDPFLQRLVEIFAHYAPSIDTVTILLREGDRLRVRATVGLEAALVSGFTGRIGEGFSGQVAAARKPLTLRDVKNDPLVEWLVMKARGLRAIYGVPLLDGQELIGVAHIGTRQRDEIPKPEMRIFGVLAMRATSAIVKHRLRGELRRAVHDLERTAEFRELFIGIVSHDLRNPLNAITMGIAAMRRSPDMTPGLTKTAGRVLANVERMRRIVEDLLDFTRGRLGGGIPIVPRPADLRRVVERVIAEFALSHPARRIDFEPDGGDTRGTWDPERLAQVGANLVGNAIQHGDPAQPVRVVVEGRTCEVELSVSNGGRPIPPELIARIFDPFGQAVARRDAGGGGGLGLGLYIVQEITRSHGGRVQVDSDERQTCFRVTLPRLPPVPAPPLPGDAVGDADGSAHAQSVSARPMPSRD